MSEKYFFYTSGGVLPGEYVPHAEKFDSDLWKIKQGSKQGAGKTLQT